MPANAFATTLRINQPAVIYETFEDEIVVIHLTRGSYYSLVAVAAQVWLALVNGAPLARLVDRLTQEYAAPREHIESSVAEFIATLHAEELIAEGTSPLAPLLSGEGDRSAATSPLAPLLGGEGDQIAPPSSLANGAGAVDLSRRPFTPPRLEVFTDMQDLLLLDPIHDVDETGWPNVPPAQRPPTR